jgi:peptidoglycan/LPS O-acetylase OafA/YrhL
VTQIKMPFWQLSPSHGIDVRRTTQQSSFLKPVTGTQALAPSTKRFVALHSLRGLCAIFVAVHNFQYPRNPFVLHSSLFVDFFFVLSGFMITHAYMSRLTTGNEFRIFIVRRLGRLWPLHVTMLMAFVCLDIIKFFVGSLTHANFSVPPFTPPNSAIAIVSNLFLIQAIGLHTELSWNVPSWSISTEFWTYILFAALCILSRGKPPPVAIASVLALSAALVMFLLSPTYLETNADYAMTRCVYGFFVGHIVYRATETKGWKVGDGNFLEVTTVLLVFAFVWICEGVISIIAPVVFGLAVSVFSGESGRISKFLLTTRFVRLGDWSYSIYMVHWLIRNSIFAAVKFAMLLIGIRSAAMHIPCDEGSCTWIMGMLLTGYLVAVIIVASVTFKFVEQPSRRYFNQIANNLKQHLSTNSRF